MAAEHRYVGLTATGTRIEATVVPGPSAASPTVLVLGGLDGNDESVQVVAEEAAGFDHVAQAKRRFRLLAIPSANPGRSNLIFPPVGVAYRDNPESHALWRWIAIEAPDLVLIVGRDSAGLANAVSSNTIADTGKVPSQRVVAKAGILNAVRDPIAVSDAHREIERRRARSPRQVAEELAKYYGHDFPDPIYINALALIGQLRLGNLAEVQRLVEPYVDGSKNSLERPTSLHLAGHLIFAELAARTGDARYLELVRRVADLGFTESGEMRQSMPFHGEMSDSVFMAGPIVARAGALTGESKYFDMAARHFAFMQKLVLRPDGLYRHSPLTDAAWGRGNAFPALGLAMTLASFPKDHPAYSGLLMAFQKHMSVLSKFQDPDGLWREVVDEPSSYAEFSATAMIGTAMLMGVRNGWLDAASYQPRVNKAWEAVALRVGPEGRLMDVCESTNKQNSLEEYLHRAAILGQDQRGGAMALIFATEMAGLK